MSEANAAAPKVASDGASPAEAALGVNRKIAIGWCLLAGLVVSLPWWHNHDHLSDLMDYGLVMAANGRIAAGERPYADFVTPIQAGFLGMNHVAERLGGGTYLGMTRLALVAMWAGLALLGWIAARRMPVVAGVGLAAVVVMGSLGQHTILWHNSVGVILLAVVLWTAALKPVWRRRDWPWHLLLLGALWLGGMNKLSYHMVAVSGVLALALRAALLDRSVWRSALGLAGWTALGGGVLPLVTELVWTGTTFANWRYNVIELAAGGRAEHLVALGQWDKYLAPLQDYYGTLRLPQIGLVGVVLAIVLLIWGWPRRDGGDRLMLVVAAATVPVVTMALLVTNLEIAYVAGAGGIAVAGAIALGFDFEFHRRMPTVLWWVPLSLFGLAAWADAWEGKRAIYGDRSAPRETYRELDRGQDHYAYLAGVKLPPEVAASYEQLSALMPVPPVGEERDVFYGSGVEWLERVWPTRSIPGLPLWLHEGTSYSARERQVLAEALSPPAAFATIVVSTPRDSWPDGVYLPIDLFTRPETVGDALTIRHATNGLNRDHDDLQLINLLGVNFLPDLLRFGEDITLARAEDGRIVFGRSGAGSTHLFYDGKVNRLTGEMVLRRRETDLLREATSAHYDVHYEAGGQWHHLARHDVELPRGAGEIVQTFEVDGRQRPLRFTVTTPADHPTDVVAGWHAPKMHNSIPDDRPPPKLFADSTATTVAAEALRPSLAVGDWQPDKVLSRGAIANDRGIELESGDQLWLQINDPLRALDGWIEVAPNADGSMPYFVVLWYQGGRVEIATQFEVSREHRHRRFHAWTPGVGGWMGFIVRPAPGTAPLTLKLDHVERSD